MLNLEHLEWLEGRGIDASIASRLGVYTGKRTQVGEGKDRHNVVTPDVAGDVLAFPTFIGGTVVGEHYRLTRKKFFYQKRGSAQYFWNGSCLDDPVLETGTEPLIITEGQIDALTAMSAGFPFAVSMPSGAQKPPDGRLATDLDPLDPADTDRPTGRFGSLYNARAQLKVVRKIVIATDTDDAGLRLAAELVRRLGPGRCWRAVYPTGCKDLNDVMVAYGREAVAAAISKAKPYPTKGLYRLNDYPDLGMPETFDTGWPDFDHHFKLAEGLFIPITGIPMHGKALALDTEIATPSGWTTMGSIQPGDEVFDEAGKPCRVIATSPVQIGRRCYRIKFNDGSEIIADEDHQWLTRSERSRRSHRLGRAHDAVRVGLNDQRHKRTHPSAVNTKTIAATLRSNNKFNHHIAVTAPIDCGESDLPVDPYVLGVWLGDGNSSNGGLTCYDSEILDHVRQGYAVSAQSTAGRYTIRGLPVALRPLSVIENKHIPQVYLRAGVEQRWRLLRGLMDTDGYCSTRGTCEFTSIRRVLAEQVYELVCSLGMKAGLSTGSATLNGRIICEKYRVQFTADVPAFTVSRKLARQPSPERPYRRKDRVIVACDPVPSVPVRCICVSSPSKLFLVTRSFIATHNSTVILNLAIRVCQRHPVRFAIGSFETPIKPVLHRRMVKMVTAAHSYPSEEQIASANAFLQDRFVFIEASDDDDAEDLTINWMLDRFHDALMRYGIKFFVIDPWNEIEHRRGFGMTQAEYQNTAIRKIKSFCRRYHATVLVCAHPTKDVWEKGKARRPSLYDIDGGAAWKNKADIGLVVHRPDMKTNLTEVTIDKCKHEHLGKLGTVQFQFSTSTSSYNETGMTEEFV